MIMKAVNGKFNINDIDDYIIINYCYMHSENTNFVYIEERLLLNMGVLACYIVTSFLAESIDNGLLFEANSGCNGCSMAWGLQCTRFEIRTVDGRKICSIQYFWYSYKGGGVLYYNNILLLLRIILLFEFILNYLTINNGKSCRNNREYMYG